MLPIGIKFKSLKLLLNLPIKFSMIVCIVDVPIDALLNILILCIVKVLTKQLTLLV